MNPPTAGDVIIIFKHRNDYVNVAPINVSQIIFIVEKILNVNGQTLGAF